MCFLPWNRHILRVSDVFPLSFFVVTPKVLMEGKLIAVAYTLRTY